VTVAGSSFALVGVHRSVALGEDHLVAGGVLVDANDADARREAKLWVIADLDPAFADQA
jgi:hypothetical protein